MRRLKAVLAAATIGALAAVGFAPAAQAAGESIWDYAYAVYPSDGDTVWVCIEGKRCDPKDKTTWKSIRLMSIQAMEVVHPDGISSDAKEAGVPSVKVDQCHGPEATDALNTLVFGKADWPTAKKSAIKLRLKSQKESSSSFGRQRRTVEAWDTAKGVWVDVQAELIKAGHVMWMPLPSALGEYAHNKQYATLAQQAVGKGQNLWDNDYCGSGPNQTASLAIDIKWDADGDDLKNVNGEWIRIRNTGTANVDLKGYSIRTAAWQNYDFTRSTVIKPGQGIKVRSGKAPSSPTAGNYYMGKSAPFFMNYDSATGSGGGAYLFDAQGDIRAQQTYPCFTACAPNPGLVITKVVYDPTGPDASHLNGEYISIKNTTSATVKLAPYMVKINGRQYSFSSGAYVKAGSTIKVRMGKGTNTYYNKYWGLSAPALANPGSNAKLVNYQGKTLSCKAWGSGRC